MTEGLLKDGGLTLRTCPKCGFTQPPDRFCANCGVNMDTYKPAPPSILNRLRKNIYLQLLLITMIVFFALNSYLSQRKTTEPEPTQKVASSYIDENVELETDSLQQPEAVLKLASTTEPSIELTKSDEAITPPKQLQLKLTYAYITKQDLELILEQSTKNTNHSSGVSGQVTWNELLPPFSFKVLKLTSFLDLHPNSTNQYTAFYPPVEGLQFGLETSVTPKVTEFSQVLMEIQILTQIPTSSQTAENDEEAPPLNSKKTMQSYQVSWDKSQVGFITGVLPHTPLELEEEAIDFFSRGVLNPIWDEAFLENQAEIILFFHFQEN